MSNHQIRELIEQFNEEKRSYFAALGHKRKGLRFHADQRAYAVRLAQEIGVRATARILGLQRKTIQRWLRAKGIWVKPCPDWVYDWAYWRRKRREKWERIKAYRGY
jgi:DNA invertase Pin-like site-specific DNA recombinase